MMDCNRSNALMNLTIDHRSSPDEQQELEQHIAGCTHCRADYDLYQSMHNALSQMSDDVVDLPDGFHESLMNRVNEVPLWKKVNRRYMNVAAALVLVVVVALIGINNLDGYKSDSDYAAVDDSATMEAPAMEKSESRESAVHTEEEAMKKAVGLAPEAAIESSEILVESNDALIDEAERNPELKTAVYDEVVTNSEEMEAAGLSEAEGEDITDASKWTWLYIIGSIVGVIAISGVLILKKLR